MLEAVAFVCIVLVLVLVFGVVGAAVEEAVRELVERRVRREVRRERDASGVWIPLTALESLQVNFRDVQRRGESTRAHRVAAAAA